MADTNCRIESDLHGERRIPADAYYAVQTARGMENFHISGVPISQYPSLIRGLAMVKLAAARANHEAGSLPKPILAGIEAACHELIDAKLHDQFAIDCIQGGAGASTNMNANEVIANRALELMGHAKGEYQHCHPNDHVNLYQSTNDAYPTALHLAIALPNRDLARELNKLVEALKHKGEAFQSIIKMQSGTTRIGKYVLNHSFIVPGLVAVTFSVASGFLLAFLVA